ncbi:MAG: choice-of-anchor L domain-containing protein [Deltaproteobacteria bacterium]|nr:choice-of-anchor L domain-containing protein [Deltaproteobacteria bacterium]
MRLRSTLLVLAAPLAIIAACTGVDGGKSNFGEGTGGGTTSGDGGTGTGGSSSTGSGMAGFDPGSGGGSSSSGGPCNAGPDEDQDQDGFTITQGDCNDCDANVNPNAVEVIGEEGQGGGPYVPADENCDGQDDELPQSCDSQIPVDAMDPMDAARAVGLCKISSAPNDWGVYMVGWVLPNGTLPPNDPNYHLGHGVVTGFGPNVNVQEGTAMLALSSGTARQPNDPGWQSPGGFSKNIMGTGHPFGFPKESPSCGSAVTGSCNDGAALEVVLRAPSNAHGFSFDFDFYTFEWPVFVCSTYNDFFAAILEPFPQGQQDGNITFDQLNNPISVNNAFFEVCGCSGGPPCLAGGINFTCALGTTELQGTGFEDHAATSWLQTQAPVTPGSEFTIRWLAYDSGDGVLDSTALVDNWEWIAEPGTNVGTEPVPNPR